MGKLVSKDIVRMGHVRGFLSGRELARHYFEEVISPLMAQHAPGLPYAAAHVGHG